MLPATPAGTAPVALVVKLPMEPGGRRRRRGPKLRDAAAHLGEGIGAKGVGAEGVVWQEAAVAGLGGGRVAVGAVEEGAAAEPSGR